VAPELRGRAGSVKGLRYDKSVRDPQALDIAAAQRLYGPFVAD